VILLKGTVYEEGLTTRLYLFIKRHAPAFLSSFLVKLELACDLLIGVKSYFFRLVSGVKFISRLKIISKFTHVD
jgi:hypothetical protein